MARADQPVLSAALTAATTTDQRALILGLPASSLTFASRAPGDRLPGERLAPLPYSGPRAPDPRADLATLRLRLAACCRLGFAHDGALSRSGAYSSCGTSLPPPLLA